GGRGGQVSCTDRDIVHDLGEGLGDDVVADLHRRHAGGAQARRRRLVDRAAVEPHLHRARPTPRRDHVQLHVRPRAQRHRPTGGEVRPVGWVLQPHHPAAVLPVQAEDQGAAGLGGASSRGAGGGRARGRRGRRDRGGGGRGGCRRRRGGRGGCRRRRGGRGGCRRRRGGRGGCRRRRGGCGGRCRRRGG